MSSTSCQLLRGSYRRTPLVALCQNFSQLLLELQSLRLRQRHLNARSAGRPPIAPGAAASPFTFQIMLARRAQTLAAAGATTLLRQSRATLSASARLWPGESAAQVLRGEVDATTPEFLVGREPV